MDDFKWTCPLNAKEIVKYCTQLVFMLHKNQRVMLT